MRYQELKIRDTFRILAMGGVSTAAFISVFLFPEKARPLLQVIFPRSHQYAVEMSLIVSGGLALMFFGVAIQYFVTSPKQNADFLAKRKVKLPPTLVNDGSPEYFVPTWKYFLSRNKRLKST